LVPACQSDAVDWFYDNDTDHDTDTDHEPPAAQGWRVIDRVYCVAWQKFTDTERAVLSGIYRELPGWQGSGDLARWFAPDETAAHLWASVEPSGIQVGGALTAEVWLDWDTRFRRAVVEAGLERFSP
jgi:hypothetical protein